MLCLLRRLWSCFLSFFKENDSSCLPTTVTPPPRPHSISPDTPIIYNVRLPAVIVTPCTPSTADTTTDELSSDDIPDSSTDDIASIDSNPFFIIPSSRTHRRARSLTGTGLGFHLRRPISQTDSPITPTFSLTDNPVKPSLLINTPSPSQTSLILYTPNLILHPQSLADQTIRSHEIPAGPSDEKNPPSLVPYPEVFDLDAYFDSNTSLQSHSSSNSTPPSPDSKIPIPIPTTPPTTPPHRTRFSNITNTTASTTSIFTSSFPPPQHHTRFSTITDTTASSTSIYTLSLSNLPSSSPSPSSSISTSTSSPTPRSRRLRNTNTGNKRKSNLQNPPTETEVRYRDHYRPPAYSRPPAFIIEPTTTTTMITNNKKFVGGKRTLPSILTSIDGIPSSSSSSEENRADVDVRVDVGPILYPARYQPPFKPSPSTFHRLGPVAISQRRQREVFL